MKKYILILLSFTLFTTVLRAQDLDELLMEESEPVTNYATATFKASRIINGHSVEQMKERELDFRISHRFGTLNTGGYGLFGLDQSLIHFSLEYGLKDWLMVGVGRGSMNKTYDIFGKVKLLKQSSGAKFMPVHVSFLSSAELITLKSSDPARDNYFSSRLTYINQLLIARKFNEDFSFQLSPTFIHRNLVETAIEANDIYAVGFGGRYKITNRLSLNAEYYYAYIPHRNNLDTKYYNTFSVGVDIETGGHVFQIMLSNSRGMREGSFIPQTTGNWFDGDVHLGFNISRVFSL